MTPDERLDELHRGHNPLMIHRMRSGFAVMSETQFLPGYALLLAFPKVHQLNDLTGDRRATFLEDMALLGDAVSAATECHRVNYAIYGNYDPYLHAHVWPRYSWEDQHLKTQSPLTFPEAFRDSPERLYRTERHLELQRLIEQHLHRLESTVRKHSHD